MNTIDLEKNIKNILHQKGISARKLAKYLEITEQGLNYTFKNNSMKVETLTKIASLLEVPIAYFFTEDEALPTAGKIESLLPTAGKARMRERKAREYNKHLASELEKEKEARQKAEALADTLLLQNSNLSEALLKQ